MPSRIEVGDPGTEQTSTRGNANSGSDARCNLLCARQLSQTGAMTEPARTHVAVYLDFDNTVVSGYAPGSPPQLVPA